MPIGTERESSLHRALKIQYAGPGAEIEAEVGGYVCDAVTKTGTRIEVQTGSFGPLKEKLAKLRKTGHVNIIYPVILLKHIETYTPDGSLLSSRRSPRRGSEWDVFRALVYAPEIIAMRQVTILLALVEVKEIRIADGEGSWRRRGISIKDRALLSQKGVIVLSSKKDYRRFVPFQQGETWTSKDLAEKAALRLPLAQKCVFTLNKAGIINRNGKRGRAYLYHI
jgi:hypothetical protein